MSANVAEKPVPVPVDEIVTHADVELPGVRLHYVSAGPDGGDVVVLLHGFPEFWYSWRHQIVALADAGYRVYAIDQRGYNTSSKPARISDYVVDTLADDVARFLDHIGAQTATIVGHDWGAIVAWVFAMRHADRLERLAILNVPHPVRMREGLQTLRQLRKSWYIGAFQIPVLPEKALAARDFALLRRTFRETTVHRDAFSELDIQRYVDAFGHEGALTGAINWYRAAARASIDNYREIIDAPTLVIWGTQDFALGEELAEPPRDLVPNARVERITDASHWVQCDTPQKVNHLLIQFLAQP